jgi:hypothetical protein
MNGEHIAPSLPPNPSCVGNDQAGEFLVQLDNVDSTPVIACRPRAICDVQATPRQTASPVIGHQRRNFPGALHTPQRAQSARDYGKWVTRQQRVRLVRR